MKLTQISVFLENRTGRLAEVAKVLGEADVSIRALSLADTSDFGIIRLIVDKVEPALEALRQNQFTANLTEVVAAEVEDRPGGLAKILGIFQGAGLNVEYMYAFVEKAGKAVLVFRFEEIGKALEVLKANDIRILTHEEVSRM